MSYAIPFNRPCLAGNEFDTSLRRSRRVMPLATAPSPANVTVPGEGASAPKVLLTTSCTHALEMAALLLDFEPGDEVIVPSFTFVSTANAFVLRGALIVFADIRPDTLNMDETSLERRLPLAREPSSRFIMPGSLARWTPSPACAGTASKLWRTMPMACSPATKVSYREPSDVWLRRVFTKPRM